LLINIAYQPAPITNTETDEAEFLEEDDSDDDDEDFDVDDGNNDGNEHFHVDDVNDDDVLMSTNPMMMTTIKTGSAGFS